MDAKRSNATILEDLRIGLADFELVSSPVTSIATTFSRHSLQPLFVADHTHLFFARIGPKLEVSPALSKAESFRVHKVTGDGRCMFRALVKGMAMNKSLTLSLREERDNADELRMAIKEVLCDNAKERHLYEEAIIAITVEESLKRYCQRIGRPDFWGGESELLVLSKLCRQPIVVYIPEHEHTRTYNGSGFIPIAEYGAEFGKGSKQGNPKKAVRLLYSGTMACDQINTLLLASIILHFGKDPKMSVTAAAYLVLVSVIGSLTDFHTLCYTTMACDQINTLLLASIILHFGKDPKMSVTAAAYLVLVSVIGSLTDFHTLCYTTMACDQINTLLLASIILHFGKDPKMSVTAAAYLVLVSVIGSLTDFHTLCYTTMACDQINTLLLASIILHFGKDPKMSVTAAAYLVLVSVIGSLTDFHTLCYTSKLL